MIIINRFVLFSICFLIIFTLPPSQLAGAFETVDLPVERYVLLPGKHLANILRDKYNIPDHLIFNEYLNLIKEINPDVKDLNNIEDNKILLIPLNLPPKNKKYRILIKESGEIVRDTPEIKVQKKLPTPAISKPEKKLTVENVNLNRILKYGLTPLIDESGGTLQLEGTHDFPDFEGSQLSLDTAAYPIIKFENNATIIVDYQSRLPVEIKEVIQSNWDNYKIFPSGKGQELESVLDQLIKEMSFYKVVKQGEPLIRGHDVLVKTMGDWLVYPDISTNKVLVINVIHTPEQKALTPIRNYLEGLAVKLVDIDIFEESEEDILSTGQDSEEVTASPEISKIDFTDKLAFIDTLLELAGQDCSQNMPISVYSRENSGLALNVTIDRTFVKNGKKHLIYLKNKSPKLLGILKKQGFPLLKLTADQDSVTTIKKLFDFLKVSYQSPIISFSASKSDKESNIWINIPGLFFETEGEKFLLTHIRLHPALISFLEEKGVQPTIYE